MNLDIGRDYREHPSIHCYGEVLTQGGEKIAGILDCKPLTLDGILIGTKRTLPSGEILYIKGNLLFNILYQKCSGSNLIYKIEYLDLYLSDIIKDINKTFITWEDAVSISEKTQFNPTYIIGLLTNINNIIYPPQEILFVAVKEIELLTKTYGKIDNILDFVTPLLNHEELKIFKGYIDRYASKENK